MNRDTLLIVDDMEINRAILRSLFEREYNILEAENGEQALMFFRQYRESLAAVLLDLVMPVLDGYGVMVELSKDGSAARVPVVILTSEDSMESEVRAFDLGAADIITKPFEPHLVKRRIQNAVELNRHKLHLEEMVEKQAAKLRDSREVLMDTLSSVIEHRSLETGQHVLRIRMFTKTLLEDVRRCYPEYELTQRGIGVIASAAALHDIGKISIPDAILNKPGALTKEEYEIMKTHTVKGCEILAGLDRMDEKEYLRYAYNICRYHHERWDGKGYPDGLKGDSIPICAQAVGIADCYDALTTDRVYKKAISPESAFTMILNGECGLFSPKLLECLKNVRKQFAELSRAYADGNSPQKDSYELKQYARQPREYSSALELDQMKYFSLLRYLDSTVMEVDWDSGIYHLVYQPNKDFEGLYSGGTFSESLRSFAEKCVYPDDIPLVLQTLGGFIEDFFESGLMKRTQKYRVLRQTSGEYVPYEATFLRIDIHDPKQRRLLIIWKECAEETSAARPSGGEECMRALPAGIQRCLNDRSLTIVSVNDEFVNLFGYMREEIAERFHNHYAEMICEQDRPVCFRQMQKQLSEGNRLALEYRCTTKDGRLIWVLDKGQLLVGRDGKEYIDCVLMDITPMRRAQEELRLTMERHQIILDQTNEIIFEWNIPKDTIFYSSNWEKKFGYEPIAQEISQRIPKASHIMPEDIPRFLELMKGVKARLPYGEAEVRIAKSNGRYTWCRIRAATQFDASGSPIKAVGVISDIDNEKHRTQELMDKADRDSLTNLYNKNAAVRKIRKYLERKSPSETSAMMIIDMDNFKSINDSRGHMFGDAVLVEVAARFERLFHADDIVARIGGDEFLAFIPRVADKRALYHKMSEITTALHDVFKEELGDFTLSCSIGIALCPDGGRDLEDLYQHCDQALYQVKMHGKNQFLFYEPFMSNTFGWDEDKVLAARTHIESDDTDRLNTDEMILRTFKNLYESGDVEGTIHSVLETIGKKYNVSRVYIFEDTDDGKACVNTFEWCNEGISPQIGNLQYVAYESFGQKYRENFNENGIFYCPDISALSKEQYEMLKAQGIRSVLQCAVRDEGRFAGFVGFDDCRLTRMWTQNQIDALRFISELLSTFLFKQRAKDRALSAVDDLRMILDHQNSWIYVIDPDTYELLYINAKARLLAPEARKGMRCYQAFFGGASPCERCPAREIRSRVSRTAELYNPGRGVWALADASFIHWGDADACMLSCHDVTPYKTKAGKAPPVKEGRKEE